MWDLTGVVKWRPLKFSDPVICRQFSRDVSIRTSKLEFRACVKNCFHLRSYRKVIRLMHSCDDVALICVCMCVHVYVCVCTRVSVCLCVIGVVAYDFEALYLSKFSSSITIFKR